MHDGIVSRTMAGVSSDLSVVLTMSQSDLTGGGSWPSRSCSITDIYVLQ